MSIASMTGFARVEGQTETATWVWEVRSVNGKGLDVRFRMPSFLAVLEDEFRKMVRAKFKRGNLQISLQLEKLANTEAEWVVNIDLMQKLALQITPLVEQGIIRKPSADGLLSVRGVLETKTTLLDMQDIQAPLQASFESLLHELANARASEGNATEQVLLLAVQGIEDLVAKARANPDIRPEAILAKLQHQVAALGKTIAPERLAQEAALLAIKADVNEELDRLAGHIDAARNLLGERCAIGRKLEFLSQEFSREANTLCAKSGNQQLTDVGLQLKTLVDQIREQAANVE